MTYEPPDNLGDLAELATLEEPPLDDEPELVASAPQVDRAAILREAVRQYEMLVGREMAQQRRARELADRAKAEAANSARVQDGAGWLLNLPDSPPAIWGDGDDILWSAGESLIIGGPQGVGKTTLAGQLLAGCLGLLPKVLGLSVKATDRRVLYLAMDRPQQAARSLARLFGPEHHDVLAERLRVWTGPPPGDFAAAPETLLEMCRQHDADRVFIDSLKDAAVGIAKDEVGAGYNRARQMALAEGIEVVELHHQRKATSDGGKPKSISDVYGSVWITAGAGSVILLWGEPGDPLVEFHHLKQPMNVVPISKIEHDAHTGLSSVHEEDQVDLAMLAGRSGMAGLSAKDAAVALFDTKEPDALEVKKARRRLEAEEKKGRLRSVKPEGTGRGKETRWFAMAFPADQEPEREWYR